MYRIILGEELGEKRKYCFDFEDFNEAMIFAKKIIESGYAICLECK